MKIPGSRVQGPIKALILAVLLSGVCGNALAATSLDPTRLGMGARSLALGRACVADPADVNSIFINPANAAKVKDWAVTSMYTSLLDGDMKYTMLGGAKKTTLESVESTFGFSYMAGMSSGIEPTTRDATGRVASNGGSFDYSNSVMTLVYGREVKNDLSLGASLKMFNKNFSGQASGSGFDMDLGMLYCPSEKLNIGVTAQNILPVGLSWSTGANEDVAMNVKAGVDFRVNDHLLVIADADLSPMSLHAGVEWQLTKIFALRGGIESLTSSGGISTTDMTAGVGINLGGFELDYAYLKDGAIDANSTHFFTITLTPGSNIGHIK